MRKHRRLLAKVLVLALIFGYALIMRNDKQTFRVQRAEAGDITSPVWTSSSTTTGASNVTYTHTFKITNALPATSGRVEIQIDTMTGQPPEFWGASLGSNTTTALKNQSIEVYAQGMGVLTLAIQNGSTAISAGTTVTLEFTGVKNPASGGSWRTNTYTLSNGSTLDGKQGSNYTSTINVGTISLTIHAAYNGTAVPGYPLEVHPQACCGLWRANTDANGDAKFYGIPDGTYTLETSHGVDPNSDTAKNVMSVYMQIEPQNVTIPAGSTVNLALNRSNKMIEVTVKYSDTGAAIQGANVNSFSQGSGGGFSFGQTNSSGVAQLKVSVTGDKSNMMVSVMPPFGPGQIGQDGKPLPQADFVSKPPMPVTFNKTANEAETISLEVLVDRPDATVTGKLLNPDNTPAMGGAGADNFRTHTFSPIFINSQDGSFSFSTSSGTGEWELHRFDPTGQYMMPKTKFTVKKGTNNLGTIKLVSPDGAITVKTYRVDSGSDAALANAPIMAFNTKDPGPPIMSFTGSDGTGSIKVMKGQTYRVMSNPGGGGAGKREGGGEGGEGKKMGMMQWIASAQAEELGGPGGPGGGGPGAPAGGGGTMGAADANQLFPTTGPQKGSDGDTITFKFDKATKKITISTIDGNGNLVTDGNWANARPSGTGGPQFGPGFGGPGAGGQATIYTTSGKFIFNAFYPPDSQYTGKEKEATITDDATVQLVVIKKTGTIAGTIQDSSNNNATISGADAKKLNLMVGAFWKGGFSQGFVDTDSGTYTVKVPPETDINVGVAPGDALMGGKSDYVPSMSPTTLTVGDGKSVTYNLSLAKVDAVINVTVRDQDGSAIEGVSVSASNRLADIVGPEGPGGPGERHEGPEGPEFGFSAVTDSTGVATINVAPDTYNLVTNARDKGLFATDASSVTIASKETKDVTINLVKADAAMEVSVNKSNGAALNDASVQVFNDRGTIAFEVADGSADDKDGSINGKVSFDLPSSKGDDNYTTKGGSDDAENGIVNDSGFIKFVVGKGETKALTLTTETRTDALAKPVTTDVSSSAPATVDLTKSGVVEASFSIPTGALSSSSSSSSEDSSSSGSSSATVTVVPIKAEGVNTKDTIMVTGDSVDALDSNGNAVKTLNGQVSGLIHYNDTDIPTGAKESNFSVKSFNEDSGQWEAVSASNCDAATNTCTFATTHLTDFAIVTSSDTTAPSAPTSISASAGDTKATLSWTKPADSDLAGTKIYRSTTDGTLGDLVTTISSTTTTSYENTGLTNGVKYYYTVRSYDTSGNISVNTAQVNATPGILPATGMSSRVHNLWIRVVGVLSTLF